MSIATRIKSSAPLLLAGVVLGIAAAGSAAAATGWVLSSPRQIKPSVMAVITREAFAHEKQAHSPVTTVRPGTTQVAVARCSRGYTAVAGGYSIEGPHENAAVLPTPQMAPAFVEADAPGLPGVWAVVINNVAGTQPVTFKVAARCIP